MIIFIAQLYFWGWPDSIGMHGIGIAAGVIYSIMPDIDTPSSKISRYFYIGILFVFALAFVFEGAFRRVALLCIVAAFIFMAAKHRGFFHSIVAGVLLSGPIMLLHPTIAYYCFYGYLSHLILDKEVSLT